MAGVALQVLIGILCLTPVDVIFGHYWEFNSISFLKVNDLFVRARFLGTKLVARESNDLETTFGVVLIDLNQRFVVRVSEPSC